MTAGAMRLLLPWSPRRALNQTCVRDSTDKWHEPCSISRADRSLDGSICRARARRRQEPRRPRPLDGHRRQMHHHPRQPTPRHPMRSPSPTCCCESTTVRAHARPASRTIALRTPCLASVARVLCACAAPCGSYSSIPALRPDVDMGAAAASTLPSTAEVKALDRQKRCEFNRVGPSSIPRAAGRFHPSAYPPSRQTWLSTLMCVLRVALLLLSSLCFQLTNSPRVPILQMTTSTFSSTYGRMSTTRRPNELNITTYCRISFRTPCR